MESVSFFSEEDIIKIANSEKYLKTPFLYLIASYVRNQAMEWADGNYKYKEKRKTGNWMIYKFTNIQ